MDKPLLPSSEIAWRLRDDAEADAKRAGLRYVKLAEPGFERRRWGRGFTYRDARGATVRDPALRRRFAQLVIPPAWTDVWICRDPSGHVQATGRDAASRKQYLYHPAFRRERSRAKYRRMVAFGAVLPAVRRRVILDLNGPAKARVRVVAGIVRLLGRTRARVGHETYAEQNGSYGLTTLRAQHVAMSSGSAILSFMGKCGRPWRLEVRDEAVLRVMREGLATPGPRLFTYRDGKSEFATAAHVNDYLRAASGHCIRAKDFRTWAGCVTATAYLQSETRTSPEGTTDDMLKDAVREVADVLHNTPAVSRSAYIPPAILATERLERAPEHSKDAQGGLTASEYVAWTRLREAYPYPGADQIRDVA